MTDDANSAPALVTDPRLREVLEELRAREPIFHHPELGTTRNDLLAQTADDFWEVGASGQRYSREFVLNLLEARFSAPRDDPWETSEFHCRELGPDTYALTYTLKQSERVTRRLTIWRKRSAAWQILFHQGTIVAK